MLTRSAQLASTHYDLSMSFLVLLWKARYLFVVRRCLQAIWRRGRRPTKIYFHISSTSTMIRRMLHIPVMLFLTFFIPWTEVNSLSLSPKDCWESAKTKFGKLMVDYEKLFNQWKLSGTHGTFQEMIDHATSKSSANTNPMMLYLHDFLCETNNQLTPWWCFCWVGRWTAPLLWPRAARGGGGGGGGRNRASRGGGGRKSPMNADENVFASMNTKQSILSYKSCSKLNFLIVDKLQAQQDRTLALTHQFFGSSRNECWSTGRGKG